MPDNPSSTSPDTSVDEVAALPPQASPGHYGPGYADPTRHFGGTSAGTPSVEAAAQPAMPPEASDEVAAPAVPAEPSAAPVDRAEAPGDKGERPDLRSDEVGFRPPDRLPSDGAPESENAALIFERS